MVAGQVGNDRPQTQEDKYVSIRKFAGVIILITPFAALFVAMSLSIGVFPAILIYGGVFGLVALIFLGVWLISHD